MAGKTIEIIDRETKRVIETHYNCHYSKYRGSIYIWQSGISMKGQKPKGKYHLSQYTWRFR
jgi:hypothetical protein